MRRWALAGLLWVAACSGDDATAPHAGTLTLTLASAGANDGAVVVVVSGGPVTAVTVPAGYEVASNPDVRGMHVMIVGDLTAGPLATISVPDASRASAYVVTVEQAADRTSFGLLDPVRYRVTVGPTP